MLNNWNGDFISCGLYWVKFLEKEIDVKITPTIKKCDGVKLSEIKQGEGFIYEGQLFLRLKGGEVLNLSELDIWNLSDSTLVKRVSVEILWEE